MMSCHDGLATQYGYFTPVDGSVTVSSAPATGADCIVAPKETTSDDRSRDSAESSAPHSVTAARSSSRKHFSATLNRYGR